MSPDREALLADQLGAIRNSIEGVHRRVDRHAERTDKRFDDLEEKTEQGLREVNDTLVSHNGRLRTVEAHWERVKGAMAAVGLGRPIVYIVIGAAVTAAVERFA